MLRLITILLVLMPLASFGDETCEKIDSLLEPVVQVRLQRLHDAGGSGTIIYSKNKRTFILTNYHVIKNALRDPNKKKEQREQLDITVFKYIDYGEIVLKKRYLGNIRAYDKDLDLALVELMTKKEFTPAKLPKKNFRLKLFMDVYSVGFPDLYSISANKGQITELNVKNLSAEHGKKANKARINANIYYGYSGGAVFTYNSFYSKDDYLFIGVPQSVVIDRKMTITWLGYFITINDVRKFAKQQDLEFLFSNGEDGKSEIRKFKTKPKPTPKMFRLEDFMKL